MEKEILKTIAKEKGSEGLQELAKEIITKIAKDMIAKGMDIDEAKETAKSLVMAWMNEVTYETEVTQ